jgi:lysophospholipase L1-like esterase
MASSSRMVGRTSLIVGALLVGLLAAEALVRLLGSAPSLEEIPISTSSAFQFSDNPRLAYGYKPNYRSLSECFDYSSDFPYINAHGFRDIERTIHKPDGVFRVALVGDSVVAGNHAGPKEMILGSVLDVLGGDEIEVLSFGVAGYNMSGYLVLSEEVAVQFEPDLVILLLEAGDFGWGLNDLGHLRDVYKLWPLLVHSRKSSHLLRLLTENSLIKRRILKPLLDWKHQRRLQRHEHVVQQQSELQALESLVAGSKINGFKLVAMAWPTFKHDQIEDPVSPKNIEDNSTVSNLREANIPLLSLSPSFRAHYKQNFADPQKPYSPRDAYAPDTCHPTNYGHSIAAQLIWQVLQQAEYLPPPSKQIVIPEFASTYPLQSD